MVGIRRLAIIFALWAPLLVKVDAARKIPDGLLREYYPSFCQSAASPAPSCKFVIFREGRQTTSIVLPFHLEWLAYSRNDRVLYTLSPSTKPVCVDRVDLNPVQLTTAVCPAGLTAVFAFAVSADAAQALISGQIKENGNVRCGVFEIRIADGEVRQVLSAEDCRTYNYERSWTSLSFAPDSSRALALRMNRLELFEIGKVGTRSIAAEVRMAEWSPDGRWIAAIDRHDKTQLIDTKDFKVKRRLGETRAEWSPDSRYLLGVKECLLPLAVNSLGTIRAIDVDTGKAITIYSSRCQVDNGSTGWITITP